MIRYYAFVGLFFLVACSSKQNKTLFEKITVQQSHIDFENKIVDTDSLNILDYLYYYNGAGVAAGDVNNDGLVDLYFNSNQFGNKLYINKGNFSFEDVTAKAGVKGDADWTTGVTMVDINTDGWLDIYINTVTNHTPQSGSNRDKTFFTKGENQLFVNNKNGTFTNKAAEFGLNIKGYNTQAVFFDYDNDGDKDMFQLQHSIHQTDTYGDTALRRKYSAVSGCKLMQNNSGKFIDITKNTGLYSSALGYGLGVAISDFNNDGWQDVYVGNDFHESDYYYINNANGTFTEKNNKAFGHQSNFSMGNDAADLNNDGWTDLVTLDMLPEDEKVLKSSNGEDALDNYESQRNLGYSYQYARNCLQLNTGKGEKFVEIGLYSGIAATDWSWSVLANDYDLDGEKDLFITNGIKQRMNDLDYIKFISSDSVKTNAQGTRLYDKEMLKRQPSGSWHNYAYKGNANLRFTDVSTNWGFATANLSNGAVYADLDNDGDADLVTNNINEPVGIFKNTANDTKNKKWLSVSLRENDVDAIGAKCYVFTKGKMQFQELQTVRGFISSVEPKLFFGFTDTTLQKADSVIIVWNNKEYQKLENVGVNKNYTIKKENVLAITSYAATISSLLKQHTNEMVTNITAAVNINWKHNENLSYIDFNRQWLIPHMYSTKGPAVAVADINGDGLEDVFFGGAKTQPSIVYTQNTNGTFAIIPNAAIAADSLSEDVDAVFLDADKDGDNDLYVASGGNEYFDSMPPLQDRLYFNDGKGNFSKCTTLPPLYENKSCVTKGDIDSDGDVDLFIGSETNAKSYGIIPKSFLLINDGKGNFTDATSVWNKNLETIGMVSDAEFVDLNKDNKLDLVVLGNWMQPTVFINTNNKLTELPTKLPKGMYQSLSITDMDKDGWQDIIVGNYGTNSKLVATPELPLRLDIADLDNNGTKDQILSLVKNGEYYPFLGKEYLEKQLPYLKKEYLSYTKIAGLTKSEIFGKKMKNATNFLIDTLGSYWLKNNSGTGFTIQTLPMPVQWSTLNDAYYTGSVLFTASNFYGVQPYEGRYDANTFAAYNYNNGFSNTIDWQSAIQGEGRKLVPITIGKKQCIILVNNNSRPAFFQFVQN